MDLAKQFLLFSMLSWENWMDSLFLARLHYRSNLEPQTTLPICVLILPCLLCQFTNIFRHYFEPETVSTNALFIYPFQLKASLQLEARLHAWEINGNFQVGKWNE